MFELESNIFPLKSHTFTNIGVESMSDGAVRNLQDTGGDSVRDIHSER